MIFFAHFKLFVKTFVWTDATVFELNVDFEGDNEAKKLLNLKQFTRLRF